MKKIALSIVFLMLSSPLVGAARNIAKIGLVVAGSSFVFNWRTQRRVNRLELQLQEAQQEFSKRNEVVQDNKKNIMMLFGRVDKADCKVSELSLELEKQEVECLNRAAWSFSQRNIMFADRPEQLNKKYFNAPAEVEVMPEMWAVDPDID